MENKTYIYHNDHAGVWQWSVSYINDPENWLDSFPTLEEALDFCRDKNLTVASTLQDGREVSDE